MDVGTRDDAGGNVKAGPPATGAGVRDADRAEDPSQWAQETVTHNREEASSSKTTGAKDEAEQATQTRDENCMQTGAT